MAGFIRTTTGTSYDKRTVLRCIDEYNNYITALSEIKEGTRNGDDIPPIPTRSVLRKNNLGGFSIPETDAFIDKLEEKAKTLRNEL